MLKYYDSAITFTEFPDEIALCVNITGCPGHCKQCSEPWLLQDIGSELTAAEIDRLIAEHPDCTVFGIMGGDADHIDVVRIANYIHSTYDLKVGVYSGEDAIDLIVAQCVDYYKIGRWIAPEGDPATWSQTNCGPLPFPFSNQIFFKRQGEKLINATNEFRKHPIHNLSQYVIK